MFFNSESIPINKTQKWISKISSHTFPEPSSYACSWPPDKQWWRQRLWPRQLQPCSQSLRCMSRKEPSSPSWSRTVHRCIRTSRRTDNCLQKGKTKHIHNLNNLTNIKKLSSKLNKYCLNVGHLLPLNKINSCWPY